MNTLKLLWAAHPVEVIAHGALIVFCAVVFAVCMIGLLSGEVEVDDFVDDAD